MKLQLLLILLLLSLGSVAQYKITGVEANLMPGLGLHSFSNDSLVFVRRQEQGTVSGSVHVPIMLHLQNQSRSSFYMGVGLRFDEFSMNKYNLSDAFFSILIIPFGGRPFADTFAIQQVNLKTTSFTLPLAYDYDLTKSAHNGIHFHVRGLLIPGMVMQKKTTVLADLSAQGVNIPTEAELKVLSTLYNSKLNAFSLFFAPEINLTTNYAKNKLGFSLGLQPFGFDLTKPAHAYLKGNTYFRASIGISYHWHNY